MYDVLIVEDDPMVAMINKQYVMQNINFRVCESCKDGLSAWEYIQKNKVDLAELFENANSQQILSQSGYRPK